MKQKQWDSPMARFPKLPNRRSLRLKGYDYRQEGSYFITICTYQRFPYFGKIEQGEMLISEIGRLAEAQWLALPRHYPHIAIDAFIIMPNHLHGILHIIAPPTSSGSTDAIHRVPQAAPHSQKAKQKDGATKPEAGAQRDAIHRFPQAVPSSQKAKQIDGATKPEAGAQADAINRVRVRAAAAGSISAVIRGYKARVTRASRKRGLAFRWHSRFHDRIIWNPRDLDRVRGYIYRNPMQWHLKYNKAGR